MYVDSEAHRQIARERHEEIARGARRIPAEQQDEPRKSASRIAAIIRRTRRRRPHRSPAYRA
jgi:hypothetical protein